MRRWYRQILTCISPIPSPWYWFLVALICVVLHSLRFDDESPNEATAGLVLCGMMLWLGVGRCAHAYESANFGWLQCMPWSLKHRVPFSDPRLDYRDFAVAILIGWSLPNIYPYPIFFSVSGMLLGHLFASTLIFTEKRLRSSRSVPWVLVLFAITLGFFICDPRMLEYRVPLALVGLYIITHARIPKLLFNSIVVQPMQDQEDQLQPTHVNGMRIRSLRERVGWPHARLGPIREKEENARWYGPIIGCLAAWLAYAPVRHLGQTPFQDIWRDFITFLFAGVLLVNFVQVCININEFGWPWQLIRCRFKSPTTTLAFIQLYAAPIAVMAIALWGGVMIVDRGIWSPGWWCLMVGVSIALSIIGPRRREFRLIGCHRIRPGLMAFCRRV